MTEIDIIQFWFATENKPKWFSADPAFDQEILVNFSKIYIEASTNQLASWAKNAIGSLALIIILDQFPRNMYRGTEQAFATDAIALSLSKQAIANGFDKQLSDEQKKFLYMPFMHSENLDDQELSLKLFSFDTNSLSFAQRHRDIIKRFSHFPHRNKILNRTSTVEEIEFLKTPGSSF